MLESPGAALLVEQLRREFAVVTPASPPQKLEKAEETETIGDAAAPAPEVQLPAALLPPRFLYQWFLLHRPWVLCWRFQLCPP